ncbi:site-specific integrase [Desulfuromonas sp. AOP6]|uniref:site-specific integrase n=1 Tax=Desulfuromonas sp. AOP6 TaxID=1566351 RepID=UPI001287680F|nr:site-specific integrase [Desulfuromonas sp. AOP6]BCA80489.1 integrase [Desulfuromonas sp. AOP6]
MATIVKRGKGAWLARIRRKGYPPQAKTFDSKTEAAEWARSVESSMDRGLFVDYSEAERTTLTDALDRYEREVTSKKKGKGQEKDRLNVWRGSALAARSLVSIRSADVASWRDGRLEDGISPHTICNDLSLLSHVYRVATTDWGIAGLTNPCEHVRRPKRPEGRDRRLEAGEEERLLAALPASVGAVVRLALETGARRGEILALRWENIDLGKRTARLPDTKNGTARDLPLSTRAVEVLRQQPRRLHDSRVFQITPAHVSKSFREACERAGVEDLRFHDLRHEATSRLFEKGLNPMQVAAITGHKTLVMLRRYTHLRAEDLAALLG